MLKSPNLASLIGDHMKSILMITCTKFKKRERINVIANENKTCQIYIKINMSK